MIKLYDNGVYLLNGTEIVESPEEAKARTGKEVSREEAAQQTMAYNILKEHNTSGNMERLQIKFDKLTSHDITFVGIIQTARASGLEKFPIPYVLTNCHNSLCAVGGTIAAICDTPVWVQILAFVLVTLFVFVSVRPVIHHYQQKGKDRAADDRNAFCHGVHQSAVSTSLCRLCSHSRYQRRCSDFCGHGSCRPAIRGTGAY